MKAHNFVGVCKDALAERVVIFVIVVKGFAQQILLCLALMSNSYRRRGRSLNLASIAQIHLAI